MCQFVKLEIPCSPKVDRNLHESDDAVGMDLDDDTTLKQFISSLKKKRKRAHGGQSTYRTPNFENSLEDQSDLNKRSINSGADQTKENCVSEASMQVSGTASVPGIFKVYRRRRRNLFPGIFKVYRRRRRTSSTSDSSIGHNEGPSESQQMVQPHRIEEFDNGVTNGISFDNLDIQQKLMVAQWDGVNSQLETNELEDQGTPNLELLAIDCGEDECYGKSLYFNDVLDIKPIMMVVQWDVVDAQFEAPELEVQEHLGLHPLSIEIKDDSSEGLSCKSSHPVDILSISFGEELCRSGAEFDSCPKNHSFDMVETISSPEPCPHPENLLSKRKVISPSSQERLRWEMNLAEHNKENNFKDKLSDTQTVKKTSTLNSDTTPSKVVIPNGGPRNFRQINGIRHAERPSVERKYGRPRSRAYHNISSSRNSIQGCSESAIEFSQRQIRDTETVAGKLMEELGSMKRIVEQVCHGRSLKNQVNEVMVAINKATRVEEVARKWLKNMSRDCSRFCKIMKMTPRTSVQSKDSVRSGKRKVRFADEAGGELYHVQLFEKGERV